MYYEDYCRGKFKDAYEYAKEKHAGQKRVGGGEFISHPLAVCEILMVNNKFNISSGVVAILHDVLEDTDSTVEEMLSRVDLCKSEIHSIQLLTKEDGYIMDEYIDRIADDYIARIVKVADRIHNIQTSMEKEMSKKFRRKYLEESKKYYIDLAKGTGMEDLMEQNIKILERYVEDES